MNLVEAGKANPLYPPREESLPCMCVLSINATASKKQTKAKAAASVATDGELLRWRMQVIVRFHLWKILGKD